jgi:hypothetical protein
MKPKRQSAFSAGSVEFAPSASAACSIKLAFIRLRDAGKRILADLGSKRENPVEKRVSGFGQIKQVGASILRIGAALDKAGRL